jgi:hypothetical protein
VGSAPFGRSPELAHCRRPRPGWDTILGRPVFGVERPLSNAWGIRGSRGGDVTIERRRRDAEAVRDLRHADVGIGEHRLGGLDVVVGEFRRTASGAANASRGSEARLGALADQAALPPAYAPFERSMREEKPHSSFSISVISRPVATNYTDDLLKELSQSGQETHFQFQA